MNVKCRDCRNYIYEWCKLNVDSPDPDMERDCQFYAQKTNLDSLKALDNDGFATFLEEVMNCANCLPNKTGFCDLMDLDNCYETIVKWLGSPSVI